MRPFQFYKKDNIYVDVCFQLSCRSFNANEWFPLDIIVQESVWKNKLKDNQIWKYTLSKEDEFIHLITRSIFDKKEFTTPYISRIEEIIQEIDIDDVLEKLDVIFFKFSKIPKIEKIQHFIK